MLDIIYNDTIEFMKSKPKTERKKIGQFFTESSTASFMANKIEYKDKMKILDAGAGSGILAIAVCLRAMSENVSELAVDLYEDNPCIVSLLESNMANIKKTFYNEGINFKYRIIEENFITHNSEQWNSECNGFYDVVISNPPYKKIGKNDEESLVMKDIVYGQPNIYFLFMAMSTRLLKKGGQLVFINPRSFTSGAYFKKFRDWFIENINITDIHLFNNRNDVFKTDKILQETLILRAIKNFETNNITITTSINSEFKDIETLNVKTDKIINNGYIFIPSNIKEVEVLNTVNSWKYTLPDLGFKLSTGKVVGFRALDYIKDSNIDNTVPLLWAANIKGNTIIHPVNEPKAPQYIIDNESSEPLLMENKNYLLLKRFSSKEEKRRLQPAIHLEEKLDYGKIGIENHLNYINGDLTKEELYGLFTLFNSTLLDMYYRILNGSTQVNATEINSIPLPNINLIRDLGLELIKSSELSTKKCDELITEIL